MTLVKICGLMRPEDVDAVNEAGADFAGFILSAGFRRSIDVSTASALAARLDETITPVGVFVNEPVEFIAEFVEAGIIRMVQLHGGEGEAYVGDLHRRLPAVPIVRAFTVRTTDDVALANASSADMVLLDNGQGTGKSFDWDLLASVSRPYVLAGGLGPENAAEAISLLRPYAVDMSSGVETDGVKDSGKIAAAVKAVRKASA